MANLSGMFSGLNQAISGMGSTGMPIPNDPRQRNALEARGVTNPMLQMLGRGLAGVTGTDIRSQEAKATEILLQAAQSNDPKVMKAAAQKLVQMGDKENALKLLAAAQKKEQEVQQNATSWQGFTDELGTAQASADGRQALGNEQLRSLAQRGAQAYGNPEALAKLQQEAADTRAANISKQQAIMMADRRLTGTRRLDVIRGVADGLIKPEDVPKMIESDFKFDREKDASSTSTSAREVPPELKNQLTMLVNKDDPMAKIHLQAISPTDPNAKIDRGAISSAVQYVEDTRDGKVTWADKFKDEDWSTIDGLKKIRIEALKNDQPELSNAIDNQIEDLVADGEGVDAAGMRSAVESVFGATRLKGVERIGSLTSQFKALTTKKDYAGLGALRERLVSSTAEDDVRALAAFNMFLSSKSFGRRVQDSISRFFTGDVTEETGVEDYGNIIRLMDEYLATTNTNIVNSLRDLGGEKNTAYANAWSKVAKNIYGSPIGSAGASGVTPEQELDDIHAWFENRGK